MNARDNFNVVFCFRNVLAFFPVTLLVTDRDVGPTAGAHPLLVALWTGLTVHIIN